MINVKTNQRYFIGFASHILKKSNDMLTLDDLHNDIHLIIIEDAWVFTDEQHREEVIHNYEIDPRNVKNTDYWWGYNSGDYYMNNIDGEIEYSEVVNQHDLDMNFIRTLNKMNKNELKNLNIEELYTRLAKKNIIENLRSEADRLEKEWSE